MKNKKFLFGEYNKFGYRLFFSKNGQVKQVYGAGNFPYDSTVVVGIEDEFSDAFLKTIRKYCLKTGKEMAEEYGWKWKGAGYNEE